MKAVVVEISGRYAALLSDDGCVRKVKNKTYAIGDVVEMKARKQLSKIAMAACLALVLGTGSIGAYAYYTPVSYVSLDVNPSIEYSLNTFDRVLSVNAVNDDGTEILELIPEEELKNSTIEDAVQLTLGTIAEQGYFEGEIEGGVVIATAGEDAEKAEELASDLQQAASVQLEEMEEEVVVEADPVGLARVQEAKAMGVTPGKLNLVQKLQASAVNGDTISTEEWLKKPVREIMKQIKENKKATKGSVDADTAEEEPAETEQAEVAEPVEGTEETQENAVPAVKTETKAQTKTNNGKSEEKKNQEAKQSQIAVETQNQATVQKQEQVRTEEQTEAPVQESKQSGKSAVSETEVAENTDKSNNGKKEDEETGKSNDSVQKENNSQEKGGKKS